MVYNSSQASNSNHILNSLVQSTDFRFMLQTVENKICCLNDIDQDNQMINLFHLFLRYFYQNIKENEQGVSNSWRTFKGRLYTRIHDKRIADLDLNGLVNLAYLFYALIKCFNFISLNSSQLKLDQLENYLRILNVFIKSKNLSKLDSILVLSGSSSTSSSSANSTQSRTNALRTILNSKFTALRLWFQTNDFLNDIPNKEEIEQILNQEFINSFNEWLDESVQYCNKNVPDAKISNPNQIARFQIFFMF